MTLEPYMTWLLFVVRGNAHQIASQQVKQLDTVEMSAFHSATRCCKSKSLSSVDGCKPSAGQAGFDAS